MPSYHSSGQEVIIRVHHSLLSAFILTGGCALCDEETLTTFLVVFDITLAKRKIVSLFYNHPKAAKIEE
jgi:Ni,Fe-hydrogenase III small subunit